MVLRGLVALLVRQNIKLAERGGKLAGNYWRSGQIEEMLGLGVEHCSATCSHV